LDFEALARFPGTLVFYMGVTTAPAWTTALIASGKSPDTPAAIVRRCSHADQQVLRCTLREVPERLGQPKKIRPPAIVIVGEVTALHPTLSWFEKRPLYGQKVLVTRPIHQAEDLASRLSECGAQVIVQPAIEIGDPPDWAPVDSALQRLGHFDWLVFSSANGVHFFLKRLLSSGRDLRSLSGIKIAAIGSGTAGALGRYFLNADRQPNEFRAEALADALSDEANGKRFLLVRASRGREILAQSLQRAGAEVEQVVAYCSTDVTQPDGHVAELLRSDQIDWITVTSSAIARALVALFGDDLRHSRLASLSPVTSATLQEMGFEPTVEATTYSMVGIVEAILKYGNHD
jgi:uroporphyrinogen III methyltransferase/synthase